MTPRRKTQIAENPTATLTEDEVAAGYRFCPEMDGHLAHVDDLKRDGVCENCACLRGQA